MLILIIKILKHYKKVERSDYMKRIPKNYYDKNFQYMKSFIKINLSDICKKLGYDRTTITSGNGQIEQYEKIREEIESRIAKLYLRDNEEL